MKSTIFSAIAAAALALVGVTSGAALAAPVNAPYTLVPGSPFEGNECGKGGFDKCIYAGSPVIAKYDVGGGWTLNNTVFPLITSSMFTVTGTPGTSGTWSYDGTTVKITHFVLKAGPEYAVFKMNVPGTDFTAIDWSTAAGGLVNDKGNARELSHITFFDTVAPIPLPAAGWLMIAGIGGLAALRRRKARA